MKGFKKGGAFLSCLAISLLVASCDAGAPTSVEPASSDQFDGLPASGDILAVAQAEPRPSAAPATVSAGIRVLLLHSDGFGNGPFVENLLVGTGVYLASDIDVNDQMRTSGTPPSLAGLLAYDCVMVWTNFPPQNPAGYGDRLKEYA